MNYQTINKNTSDNNIIDDTSIKELIYKIKELIGYLTNKWRVLMLGGLLSATIGYIYAYLQKPLYTASLSFALEDEKAGGSNFASAIGLASSLGIDFGGSAGGAFSGTNLTELMKSRSLVEKTLLQPVIVNGKTISLATFFIETYQLNKGWEKKNVLSNLSFPPYADRTKFSLQQDSILGILHKKIAGKKGILSISQKDKKISILTVEVASENELFSKYFTEALAKVVSEFYIETKTKKAKNNYEILQKQTDSIRNELNMAISGVAVANDMTYNLNPAFNVKRIPSAKRQIDVQANTAILTQLVANLEMSKVALRKETPLIQIIDTPILPLEKTKIGKIKTAAVAFFLGVFLITVFFTLRRWVESLIR